MLRVAVFASGGGSNFQALIDKKEAGELPQVELALLLGNNSKATAFERAQKHSIETCHIAPSHFESNEEYTEKLLSILEEKEINFIVLAGYMKKIPDELVRKFAYRMINIHPALLPAFGGQGMYGINVHRAVIEYGAKLTGITIHYIDEVYDSGKIIYQAAVPVLSDDTPKELAKRVLQREHDSYWRVLKAISEEKISLKDGKVCGTI